MQSATKTQPTKLLCVEQVAEVLHVSRRTVFSMIAAGRLRAVKLGERTTRIPVEDVESLIQAACEAVRGRS